MVGKLQKIVINAIHPIININEPSRLFVLAHLPTVG